MLINQTYLLIIYSPSGIPARWPPWSIQSQCCGTNLKPPESRLDPSCADRQLRAIQYANRWPMEFIKWPNMLTRDNAMGNFFICGSPLLIAVKSVTLYNNLFCFLGTPARFSPWSMQSQCCESDQCNRNAANLASAMLSQCCEFDQCNRNVTNLTNVIAMLRI